MIAVLTTLEGVIGAIGNTGIAAAEPADNAKVIKTIALLFMLASPLHKFQVIIFLGQIGVTRRDRLNSQFSYSIKIQS